jgi:hypothetical protein
MAPAPGEDLRKNLPICIKQLKPASNPNGLACTLWLASRLGNPIVIWAWITGLLKLCLLGSSRMARRYSSSVKRGIVKPGKPMISKEYAGAKGTIWSLFGVQFGEEFGEVLTLEMKFRSDGVFRA